ncbi:MAG: hypothetical protein QXQ30_01770 [Candidatus Pacearchaeota archaeon]
MKKKKIKIKKEKNKKNIFYIGSALAIIAIIFLIINSIVGFIVKSNIEYYLGNSKEFVTALNKYGQEIKKEINNILSFLCIFWLFLSFLIIISLIGVYQDEKNWFYFLILAILALFSFRIESSILLFASSILFYIYKKNNKK